MFYAIALMVLMTGICVLLDSSGQPADDPIDSESPDSEKDDQPARASFDGDLQRYREAYYAAWQKRQRNIKLESHSEKVRIGYADCYDIARALKPAQTLYLKRDNRKTGEFARVSVWLEAASGDVELGHLPQSCSGTIASQMARGLRFSASVDRIEIHGPLGQFVSIYVDLHCNDEPEVQRDPGPLKSLERAGW